MPQIILWSWELGPDLSPKKASDAYRVIVKADPCAYCGGHDPKAVVDHIVPRASWGSDGWDNLVGSCRKCNASKRSDTLLGFLLGEGVGLAYGQGQYYPGEWERARARRCLARDYAERIAA